MKRNTEASVGFDARGVLDELARCAAPGACAAQCGVSTSVKMLKQKPESLEGEISP